MTVNAIMYICCKADTIVRIKERPLNISTVKLIKVQQSRYFS
jgi:hypothetical protein